VVEAIYTGLDALARRHQVAIVGGETTTCPERVFISVALLGWVSSTGNLVAGFLYLFVFALGLGTLFVVIGTFAGALTAGRFGSWPYSKSRPFSLLLSLSSTSFALRISWNS
jgi:hypothetical protein